jgi:hypothetical protein
MSTELLKAQIKAQTNRLTLLLSQYEAVNSQMDSSLDSGQKVLLEKQVEDIEKKIEKAESELKSLNSKLLGQSASTSGLQLNWQENLPKIDYKKARTIARDVFTLLEDTEGGVLFLLQNSNPMGGEWCIKGMKNLLDKNNGKFRHIPIEFSLWDTHDELQLINKFKERLNADTNTADPKQVAINIIETLCKSLQSGSTIFIEITIPDSNALQEKLLPWFVENFWCPLVDKLSKIAPLVRRVKCVTTIVAPSALSAEFTGSLLCCPANKFDQKKVLELPLEKWTESDIEGWLIDYSGLSLDGKKYGQLASYIYSTSDCGLPSSAHTILMNLLSKYSGG